ncbi:MAG: hypothetical protein WAO71_05330 [Gallionella sp.]
MADEKPTEESKDNPDALLEWLRKLWPIRKVEELATGLWHKIGSTIFGGKKKPPSTKPPEKGK